MVMFHQPPQWSVSGIRKEMPQLSLLLKLLREVKPMVYVATGLLRSSRDAMRSLIATLAEVTDGELAIAVERERGDRVGRCRTGGYGRRDARGPGRARQRGERRSDEDDDNGDREGDAVTHNRKVSAHAT
jgi:hypothetical protein